MHLPSQDQETWHPCCGEMYYMKKDLQNLQSHCCIKHVLTHYTIEKSWTVEKSSKIKLEKQHFDILTNTETVFLNFVCFTFTYKFCSFKFFMQPVHRQESIFQWTHHSKAWTTLLLKDNLTVHTENGKKSLIFQTLGSRQLNLRNTIRLQNRKKEV